MGDGRRKRFQHLEWPTATIALILSNILMFIAQQFLAPGFQYQLMLRPDRLDTISWLTSMFMHADLLHLGVNMLFLWIFGIFLELRLGWARLLILYMLSGLGAGLTFLVIHWDETTAAIGASGAVAGLMGLCVAAAPLGRLTLLPENPVWQVIKSLKRRRARLVVPLVAWVALWVVSQFFYAWADVPGIAFASHFGGIVAGLFIGMLMRTRRASGAESDNGPNTILNGASFYSTITAGWTSQQTRPPDLGHLVPPTTNLGQPRR